MDRQLDKVQFESRSEVDEVCDALSTFVKEHPDSRSRKAAERLAELLDVMYMEW